MEVDNNGDGYSDVSDICGALYDESAKCNKYMGNQGDYAVSSIRKMKNFVRLTVTNITLVQQRTREGR